VEADFQPDLAVVEPSGVAQLGSLLEVLQNYAHNVNSIKVLSLIDIRRYDVLMKVVSPLITSHVEKADLVALNKVDGISPHEVDSVMNRLREIKEDADVFPVSATQGTNMDSLFQRLIG
jgi:G3E family GTPase